MNFEIAWNNAAYNSLWWTAITANITIGILVFTILVTVRKTLLAWLFVIALYLIGGFIVVIIYSASVQEKWRLRYAAAVTQEEINTVCNRDGANLVFAPIIGIFQVSCACGLSILFGGLIRKIRLANKTPKRTQCLSRSN